MFAKSMQLNTIFWHFREDLVLLNDMVRSKTADDPFNHSIPNRYALGTSLTLSFSIPNRYALGTSLTLSF
jgi:hypothetical protein